MYKVEKLEGNKIKINFTLTTEDFDKAIDRAFSEVVKNLKADGFRPGKMPKNIYIKKYGVESLYNEAIDYAINDAYYEFYLSGKYDVLGDPSLSSIEEDTIGVGKKLKFSLEVELYPEVTLGAYKDLEVVKDDVKVSDTDIDEYITRIRNQHADLEVVEGRALQKGDTAVFDYDGSVDGVHFDGGKADNYSLEIGSGQFIPGFEDQMVGMNTGEEKVLKVKFPEDYHAENLKGKDADFAVKLHEIKEKKVPELDKEFVEELEIEGVTTVKQYQKYVKDLLKKENEEASKNKFDDDVLNLAIDNASVEIPDLLVEREIENNVRQLENQAKAYGITTELLLKYSGMAEDINQYKELVRPNAIKTVKSRLVYGAVAKAEKLKVSAKDYEAEVEEIAKETGKSKEDVMKVYSKDMISPYILNQKAVKLILASAKAKKAEVKEEIETVEAK